MRSRLKNIYRIILFGLFLFGVLNWPYLGETKNDSSDTNEQFFLQINLKPNTIYIPALSLSAPLVDPLSTKEQDIQQALVQGVAHYPASVAPGKLGNAIFVGHSSDYIFSKGNYKTVFSALANLNIGDDIHVSDGMETYHYIVTKKQVVKDTDLSIFNQNNFEKKLLTLQTSYPLGTAFKRFVVVAEIKE